MCIASLSPRRFPATLLALLALWLAAPLAAQDRYLAFGDSITSANGFDDCNTENLDTCGYPVRLRDLLLADGQNIPVENHGKGGERTPGGMSRLVTVLADRNGGEGDVLLLMEGTNDITQKINPEVTLSNLDDMAFLAEDRDMETVHATLIPRFPQATRDPENTLNLAMARAIRGLAFSRSRNLVDPFEHFSHLPNLFEDYYWDPEDLTFPDPVGHPNPDGFDELAELFFDALNGRDTATPVVAEVEPADGSVDISPLFPVRVRVYDFGSGIDPFLAGLRINGQSVAVDVSSGGENWLDIVYRPTGEGLPETVTVTVQTGDRNLPPNFLTEEVSTFTVDDSVLDECVPDEHTLCIDHQPGDRRFRVRMDWQTALNGGLSGTAFVTGLDPLGFDGGGMLSFFAGTPEALVKIIDGCTENGRFWIFAALTTTLGFDLTIEDIQAKSLGAPASLYRYEVSNPDGKIALPVADIRAFETCGFNSP
jgi:lysophospholipase L1-like esterase